uniref:phosphoribosylamine--glycine ligase n=1 Tax=Wollemia nobilis TaxID=56998 RepID=A0A0C9RHH8_9CONI
MAGAISGITGSIHSALFCKENRLYHWQELAFKSGGSFGRISSSGHRLKLNCSSSARNLERLLSYSKWAPGHTWFGEGLDGRQGHRPGRMIENLCTLASGADSGELSSDESQEEGVVVLVIGGGGREHALCYALQRSSSCDAVFCAPGNAGIADSGDATCISDLDILNSSAVISFCQKWGVGLVVVGPESPLVAGLVNDLVEAGIPAFGPSSKAAALEGSKEFMKKLCDKYAIPTAKYQTFTDASDARKYIQQEGAPIVVKADGLAAGKGVVVAKTLEEAYDAVDTMLVKKSFGGAGSRIIVEEFLEGEEVSFFAIVDGENSLPLASAQDHKRVGDGDTGPNTGGMGAYSPAPLLTKELESVVMKSIILPTVKGMDAEGCKFVGVLYAGLIIDSKSGLPKLLEYNVRFGDPECQVLMVRLESDLVQILLAACKGQLNGVTLNWSEESALVVVLASKGYPGNYTKGTIIKNLQDAEIAAPKVKIFHAGTALDLHGNKVAVGGRVLGVTAMGSDIAEAQERAYQAVDAINWPEGFCRRDIGWRAISRFPIAR